MATNWVKKFLSQSGRGLVENKGSVVEKELGGINEPLEVLSISDSHFTNKVELSVRFGKSLIITDCDGLEPYLVPLIRREISTASSRPTVQLGERSIDINEEFRLILVCHTSMPQLPRCVDGNIIVINFSVSKSGLQDQLLSVILKHEEPELEERRELLSKKEEVDRVELNALENTLLDNMTTMEGDLISNVLLVQTLARSKLSAEKITEALEESAIMKRELDKRRDIYQAFACYGSRVSALCCFVSHSGLDIITNEHAELFSKASPLTIMFLSSSLFALLVPCVVLFFIVTASQGKKAKIN